ncbi:lytic murein transglycosylase B [Polynucleobacter sp. AM-26B4]|nr:lytic murein transglycosylase B [Polynucleobacter sp. AM-26B4]MBU3584920.1 lytic murein transglycosylase B [Polynucleobacter sp. AM-26B4]
MNNTTSLTNRFSKLMISGIAATLLSACANLSGDRSNQASTSNQSGTSADSMGQAESINADSLQAFLEQVSKNHQIPLNDLKRAFDDTKAIPSIKKLVMPPPPGFQKNWKVYRSRFVEPRRLAAGQKFWATHRSFIEKTEKETGVPAEIIVSIIGVETIYGRHMGGFSVRDTLSTLGFDYPNTPNKIARETLFKNQLEDLILLCWAENRQAKPFKTCLNQTGSYAGAIGLPQFMPGSIRRFAVDGNKDGKIDLRNSPEDAIASVANFLKVHGWVQDEPIYLEIESSQAAENNAARLADGEPKAKLQLGHLVNQGLLKQSSLPTNTPSLIVDLPSPGNNGGTDVRYVIGLRNFLAICDYNRSFFYAQSVAEFAEALDDVRPASEVAKKATNKSKNTKKTAKKSNSSGSSSSKVTAKSSNKSISQ